MRVETNLERIRQLSEEHDDKNWEFRAYLKQCDADDIDSRVDPILKEVTAAIDCTQCGNCCTCLRPVLGEADVARLAEALSCAPTEFREQYTENDEDGACALRGKPCPLLEDKRCACYDARPEDCRSYPHLHKEGFTFRLASVIANCAICPIVFNVYERLKNEMWPRYQGKQGLL